MSHSEADPGGPGSKRIIVAGLEADLATWLEQRLDNVAVLAAHSESSTFAMLGTGRASLLIVDHHLTGLADVAGLFERRDDSGLQKLPVFYCLDPTAPADLAHRLVGELGVTQLFYHPLDREELARQAATVLGVPLSPLREPADRSARDTSAAMAELWDEFKGGIIAGIDVLDEAVAALRAGKSNAELRRRATQEAHRLIGTVGTAGFYEASVQAREVERLLQVGATLGRDDIERLTDLVRSLRYELSQPPPSIPRRPALRVDQILEDRSSMLLVVDDDQSLGQRLAVEAAARGLRTEIALNISGARQVVARERPDVVLLDLTFPDGIADSQRLLTELTTSDPPIPVLVLTGRDAFTDRVEVARLGGRGFLQKPLAPAQVLEAVTQVLRRVRAAKAHVLAVDDDPHVLATLRSLLVSPVVRVTTERDPLQFWETLESASPDLLVLDVDMPYLSGIELCRIVRNEPRWNTLPIVFLTGHNDPDIVHRLFAVGADDYVSKPIVGPELVTRIKNRLERTQLLRSLAETDTLTGLANRYKANQILDQYIRLADRNHESFCLALIDLDSFKEVNDRFGHVAGDNVLRRFGQILVSRFRSEDIVARWGGEEFIVGMYGMTRANGVRRLTEVLAALRQELHTGEGGAKFQVTFSAGVAALPSDGGTMQSLFRVADAALYQAKGTGRNRVVSTEDAPLLGEEGTDPMEPPSPSDPSPNHC